MGPVVVRYTQPAIEHPSTLRADRRLESEVERDARGEVVLPAEVGRADLGEDPRMAHNDGRVIHEQEIDAAIAAWTATLDAAEVLQRMDKANVPAGPIYSVADMFADPHFQERGLFEQVEIDGQALKIPAILPKLSATPGATRWPGGELGSHNDEVFKELLGMDEQEISTLREQHVI